MQHDGHLFEIEIRKKGIPITVLSRHTGWSRQHIYSMFKKSIWTEAQKEKIQSVIQNEALQSSVHFESKMNQKYALHQEIESLSLIKWEEDSADYWKMRYILLLERFVERFEDEIR